MILNCQAQIRGYIVKQKIPGRGLLFHRLTFALLNWTGQLSARASARFASRSAPTSSFTSRGFRRKAPPRCRPRRRLARRCRPVPPPPLRFRRPPNSLGLPFSKLNCALHPNPIAKKIPNRYVPSWTRSWLLLLSPTPSKRDIYGQTWNFDHFFFLLLHRARSYHTFFCFFA